MPSSRVSLCDLTHTCSQYQLKLSSSCSALFSYDADIIASSYSTQSFISPTFDVFWMKRGVGFRLCVTIVQEGVSINASQLNDFINKIGIVLKDAEV